MSEGPYTRVTFDGKTINARTRDALLYAQQLWRERGRHTLTIRLAQGSYRKGNAAAASGTTHDGGGVVDIRTSGVGLTTQQRKDLVRSLKDAGFAAWNRDTRDGMSPHVHAIAIADREMSASAGRQVQSYDRGRNGLNGDGKDRGTYRACPQLRFSYKQGKPVPR
jgi:hypothetical protein